MRITAKTNFFFESCSTARLIAIVGSVSAPAKTDRTVSAALRMGWLSVLLFMRSALCQQKNKKPA